MKIFFRFFHFSLLFFIAGCVNTQTAPIVEGWHESPAKKSAYIVQKGDTLYSIAWAFDMDFRDLAKINHLSSPYYLKTGQKLQMASTTNNQSVVAPQILPPALPAQPLPLYSQKQLVLQPPQPSRLPPAVFHPSIVPPINSGIKTLPPYHIKKEIQYPVSKHWVWPTQGRAIRGFSLVPGGNRGLEIAGKLGQPIVAAAPGKVVYAGSGLRGYGNLVIIKHSDTYLSAYAYNKSLLVKEGTWVKAGQKVALMGQNNSGQVLLHFEIRRNGKPINPLQFYKTF